MNGEVMDESTEVPQHDKNEISEQEKLLDNKKHNEKKEQIVLVNEKEENYGEKTGIISDVDKDSVRVEEVKSPCSTGEKATGACVPDICDENVEAKEILHHVKKTEEVRNEDTPSSFTTSTSNGFDKKTNDHHFNIKRSPEPESELENSNSFPEKINNNSKDSSILSTTDTQDEIDTIDNGDQLFINHDINNQLDDISKNEMAKKEMLDMGMESEDSIEDMLGSDLDPQTEETFSIVSGSEYDEASQGSVLDKNNDVILLENDGLSIQNGNKSPEVHEIESDNEDDDDCIVTTENKTSDNKEQSTDKTELRRSNRAIKRKKYSYDYENVDEESDIEEVLSENLLKRKSRPIMINDTKSLVEIAAKQAARSTSAQRKEPQLVLIGSSPTSKTTVNKCIGSNLNASLYQSIVARGTTVTPVPSKQLAATSTQACQTPTPAAVPTPAILPSLTDDMFVVEAPSFIVPYVYEKPSIEPFREFVNKLGKELEEKKAKAENELLEKKKEEKVKRQKEKQDKKDRGEEVEDSEEEVHRNIEEIKKRKMEKKEKRNRQKEEDDSSWDGSDSSDSEDFKLTDENGTTILINEKDESVELKGGSATVSSTTSKSDNYFACSLGKFFMNIGMGLVEEYVQTDLLKQQKRKLQREKKSGESTKERELSISLLMKNLQLSKENNEPYTCSQLKCEHCSFKTESALVLAQHLETPHMKNHLYKCNFCSFEIRSPHDILFHMKAEHNVQGKLERTPAYHQCANCPFEDNGKGKLARHLVACAKRFKPEHNLSPPLEWEPPAKIPKIAKARNTMLGSPYTGTAGSFGRPQFGSSFGRAPIVTGMMPGVGGYRPRSRFPAPGPRPIQAGGSIVRGSSMLRQNTTSVTNFSIANSKKSLHQPSISITPLPRQPPPIHVQASQNSKGTFVICEICDGYIKDLDQLRNHMQWIHKVKIHPKMIYNRPPLNCQKCQFRFFTDQGLERHLLGSHGLVTSSMQEAANKSKDAGRCPVCGKVYQWKLLNHVARDHNLTLKPAHLSYKCTVCTATFGMYKLFENHVYSAHSVVAKRVMDKNVIPKTKNDAPKGLKINDEITITAQPAKAAPNKDK